ncbi:MAG: glycosyltransferase [Lachnospiraceae bacterium]|jgi:glycosyltransferase involved in cell wall biosynthesis
MKVILLGHLHGFGGAEKSLILLANQLVLREHKVTLVTLTANNCVYPLDSRVKKVFFPDKGKNKGTKILNRIRSLNSFFQNNECDLVISFWFQIGLISMILSKFYGYKTIYSERGDPADREYSGILGLIRNLTISGFDGFVFQTKGARDFFKKNVREKSVVIHNAISIDDKIFLNVPEKKRYIVGVGRLHRQKNFALLIRAFYLVHMEYPEYKLIIYGEGAMRESLTKLIAELDLTSNVELYGNTQEPLNKLLEADMFVLSSDFEGMPNALMEAMALGLPCVSTDCTPGGAAELITDHVNGILVERNNEKALAAAMQEYINNPQKANDYGKMASEIKKTHSLDYIYNKWDMYIRKVCQ